MGELERRPGENAPSNLVETASNAASRAAAVAAWGSLGSLAGMLVALAIPALRPYTPFVTYCAGALTGALAAIGVLRHKRHSPLRTLAADLREADDLFLTGLIDEVEHRALRASLLGRYTRQ